MGTLDHASCPPRIRPRVFDTRTLRWRPIEPSWARYRQEEAAVANGFYPEGIEDAELNYSAGVKYALNQAQVGSTSEDYGTIVTVVQDIAALGVTVLRQPGSVDPSVQYLLPDVAEGADGVPLADSISSEMDPNKIEQLQELLLECWRNGVKVALTVGVYGAGTAHSGTSVDERIEKAITFTWSISHLGEELDGNEFGYVHQGRKADDELVYLDTRDRYQWYWLRECVREVCWMLLEQEETIRNDEPDFDLASAVASLSICNELDTVNIVNSDVKNYAYGEDSWQRSARNWAKLTYRLAVAAREELPETIPIWLAGLSSYDVDEDLLQAQAEALGEKYAQNDDQYTATWTWHINWLAEFLVKFAELADDDGLTRTERTALASALDYHWYHRSSRGNPRAGPLHITRLVFEMARIREVLDDTGFAGTQLTLFESGASALGRESDGEITYDFVPTELIDRDVADRYELHQAFQVWRRLAGACASGAKMVGWHSLQGSHSKSGKFYGMGLREDKKGIKAKRARPRLAWYCFQRFTQVFSDFAICSIVLPASATTSPVNRYESNSRGESEETSLELDLVVFEFIAVVDQQRGFFNYAYLIMLDGWRSASGGELLGTASGDTDVDYVWVRTIPDTISASAADGDDDDDEFPVGSAIFGDDRYSTGRTSVEVRMNANADPKLYLSSGRLTWEVVKVYE